MVHDQLIITGNMDPGIFYKQYMQRIVLSQLIRQVAALVSVEVCALQALLYFDRVIKMFIIRHCEPLNSVILHVAEFSVE